jgi:hypothetical protein
MTKPDAARNFLLSEVEGLEPFDMILVAPAERPLRVAEVTRTEGGGLEVRMPGRPPIVPQLEPAVVRALNELEFASEDPGDPTKPWARSVEDAESAVELLQKVRVEVFGEKPDVNINIMHGSHRAEHEATQKLAHARARIESIVSDLLGRTAEKDQDGDYLLPIGQVHVTVAPRAMPDGVVVIRIFAITNVNVDVTPELDLFLARLNFGLMFGRFALDAEHRSIWFDETLLGEEFREEEFRFVVRMIASTADNWDDQLKQMFGGVTYQEVLAGRSVDALPPIKPGEGTGMYL